MCIGDVGVIEESKLDDKRDAHRHMGYRKDSRSI